MSLTRKSPRATRKRNLLRSYFCWHDAQRKDKQMDLLAPLSPKPQRLVRIVFKSTRARLRCRVTRFGRRDPALHFLAGSDAGEVSVATGLLTGSGFDLLQNVQPTCLSRGFGSARSRGLRWRSPGRHILPRVSRRCPDTSDPCSEAPL
jgi:hypothetical protein